MCMYIGSEVLLSNLLNYYPKSNEGIDFSEIEKYCIAIKEAIANDENSSANFISFRLNDDELESNLRLYPGVFKKFMDKYYKGKNFNGYNFDSRVRPEISLVMKRTASTL